MPDIENADALQTIFEKQQSVTTYHENMVQAKIEEYRALREGDVDVLKALTGWPANRRYIPDPLAEKISESFADMLYGEDPVFKSATTVAKEMQRALEKQKQAAQELAAATAGQNGPDQLGNAQPPAKPDQPNAPDQLDDTEQPPIINDVEETEETQIADYGSGDDQDRLNDLVEANDLPSELHSAEVTSSSEGEVWWRIYKDLGQSEFPIVEWHSRSHVRPLFRGRHLLAVAFVSEVHREEVGSEWTVYRYVEIHTEGYLRNLLYKGTSTALGGAVALDTRPETANLEEEWQHELGMLCGRIHNKLGRDRRVGRSDYHNVRDLLLSLNEATTIGHENMRLTAKKRIAVPREALGSDNEFDASEDVLVVDKPLDDELGAKTAGGQFAVLEYSYDSTALIEHKLDQIATILSRVGIVAEFANAGGSSRGSGGGGLAISGTALRMRLIPTTLAANGKKRPWVAQLPKIVMLAQQLDALPEERGGFGRSWQKPAEPPAIELGQPLPTDETEETNRHVSAVGGEIESRRTAIGDMHPTWDNDQVEEELAQIKREVKEFASAAPKPPSVQGQPFGPAVGGMGGLGTDNSTDSG